MKVSATSISIFLITRFYSETSCVRSSPEIPRSTMYYCCAHAVKYIWVLLSILFWRTCSVHYHYALSVFLSYMTRNKNILITATNYKALLT